jgi:hypothetical protein
MMIDDKVVDYIKEMSATGVDINYFENKLKAKVLIHLSRIFNNP